MNEKLREPAYRAAYDSAQTELGQICERMIQLRARQDQIHVAAEALKLLVGSDGSLEGSATNASVSSKTVFEINTKDFLQNASAPQQEVEEEPSDPIQKHIRAALRVPTHA
jgi:hypothetical protein